MSYVEGCLRGEFRNGYSEPVRVCVPLSSSGKGAVQSEKDACDINRIMAKYQKTGVVTWLEKREGQYRDVTGLDFMEAMDTIVKGREMFDELPSSVREKFRNDPALFLDFMHDPNMLEEQYRMGLAVRPVVAEPPAPLRVEVVAPKVP